MFFENFQFPFDALRPRRAPTFWPAESRQRLAKEGCAPFGIPPAVALECLRHNRARGVTELLAAYAAGASGRFAKASPQKPFRTRYHARSRMTSKRFPMGNLRGQGGKAPKAGAHDRQTFPSGERGGQGGEAPKTEAVEVRQSWRARTRSRFPQRHRSSSREAARSSAKFTAPAPWRACAP